MSEIRKAYLEAAESAAELLAAPEVAAAWARPSALAEFSVSGLCGHLANQVFSVTVGRVTGEGLVDQEKVPLLEHYLRAEWIDAPVDAEINVLIRDSGERAAGDRPADLVRRLREHIAVLREVLPVQPAGRVVSVGKRWNLTLDDYLVTRMMEIAVHSDDVAVSVGVEPPPLPPTVLEPVVDLLARLSLHKHGQAAMLRALTRSERAPADITAF
jgi:hypothetical protein